jgi:hypothetical protein
MPYKPRIRKILIEAIQKLWDKVDLCNYRHFIEQLICKIEDVIYVRGLATIN